VRGSSVRCKFTQRADELVVRLVGRASPRRGAPVRRPNGQVKSPQLEQPQFAPSARLDYETELGVYIGTSSTLGIPIPIPSAGRHVFGFCLLNDWSARDLQVWEYQPLGPFLAKNFATTVSAWVVPAAALLPYRVAGNRHLDAAPGTDPVDCSDDGLLNGFEHREP
jgi:fumarylacetoacetase